ncbi:RIP metalloprotease RseP [Pedobacter sp. Hv1]|uniref:RIP metalloprotease RseP n=1 Tax=Pedobacter sp. Hv1 TaxID=1740090 RepID=UPI0006D8BD85|nr:RIP metalloprotease RseP [Pedobacter sp. Hv1]KQC02211.1 RIP metalloprotease RseP [Pedobacter sp. Hv1]
MDGLIMAGQLLLGLSILVILHELGHFLAARAFGIKVEKFYLFFDAWGFKLFSFKVGDTEYGVGWLPLGGYVKISGMIDESMDTEQMALPAEPWEFRSKPAWQRLIVMLGGIIVNVVVGIVIFWMLTFKYGETYITNNQLANGVTPGIIGKEIGLKDGDKIVAINGQKVVRFEELISSKVLLGSPKLTISRDGKAIDLKVPESVLNSISKHGIEEFVAPRIVAGKITDVTDYSKIKKSKSIFTKIKELFVSPKPETPEASPALEAGIKAGDSILSVNNKPVRFLNDFTNEVEKFPGKVINIEVLRNGNPLTLTPKVSKAGTIGIAIARGKLPTTHIDYGFFESFSVGTTKAWTTFADNGKGIWKMITGKVSARNISSPIGIAKVYGSEFDWANFWRLTGLISMALAFMNLLPIPALDGGHVVFLIIEMIKGKPLGDKFMERAQVVGFVILLSLMVFAFGNDILKIFGK